MGMIHALGAFWLDYGTAITAVSAGIVLIGAAFNVFKNNSISKESVTRTAQAENTLGADHKLLLERSADMKASVASVRSTIQEDRLQRVKEQVEQKIQYATLSDAQKRLDDHAREIGKFADEFRRLATENAALKAENQHLRNCCMRLDDALALQPIRCHNRNEPEL